MFSTKKRIINNYWLERWKEVRCKHQQKTIKPCGITRAGTPTPFCNYCNYNYDSEYTWMCDDCDAKGQGDIPIICPECGSRYILSENESI